jgi:hypothetical protein
VSTTESEVSSSEVSSSDEELVELPEELCEVPGGEVTPMASVIALKAFTCPRTETVASKTPTSAKPDKMTREVDRFK